MLFRSIVDNEVETLTENLDIALKCLALSFEEKADLAYALGIDARGLTHKELVSRLIGPNLTGDAITRKNVFVHFYESADTDRKVKVYAQKAITLGIIKLENGYYRVGGRTLGSNERDVIDMCQSDKDFFYGFIKVEVDKVITEPSEKLDDMTKEDVTEVVTEKIQEIKKNRTKKAAIVDALTV